MSHSSQRSRTSTSSRGYYNLDQVVTPRRNRSIKIVTNITQSPLSSSPVSSTSSLSISRPTIAVPYAPEPPSPRYQTPTVRRSPSFTRERQVVKATIVTRSPEHYPETSSLYNNDTQGELAHYYKRQVAASREPQRQIEVARSPRPSSHRTKSVHSPQHQERYELALVPVQHRDHAIIVERIPASAKPVVVERKQTMMIRDDQGRWCKVRRVIR